MNKSTTTENTDESSGLLGEIHAKACRFIRMLHFLLTGKTRYGQTFYTPQLVNAVGRTRAPSHISEHLGSLFFFTVDARPKLIVELGTNEGESTRVLLAAAAITDATVLSVDISDCGHLELPYKERWHFVTADDVEFGRTAFSGWCRERTLEPVIDLLFIDTSHEYDHTKREIETWAPFLSDHATVVFHDTNMGTGPYGRLDGSVGFGYDNERGVIKVIEELVGRRYDETTYFSDFSNGCLILHHPNCAGLAVLKVLSADFRSRITALSRD